MGQYQVKAPEVPEYKRVIFKKDINKKVKEGIDILTEAVASTLGPNGKNVIIKKNFDKVYTKDGVTVARSIDFHDYEQALGAALVKEAAVATNNVAGDGTTCATILTHALITEGLKKINKRFGKVKVDDLVKEIESDKNYVIGELKEMAQPIQTKQEVIDIATISSNDKDLGRIIGDIYNEIGKEGNIVVEESPTNETEYEVVKGLRYESGYISPYFLTNYRREKAELEDAAILMTNLDITSFQPFIKIINDLIAEDVKNLLVIGNKVSGEALLGLVQNHQKGVIKALATEAPLHGLERDKFMDDLAMITGGKYIAKDSGVRLDTIDTSFLGRAKKVMGDRRSTIIVEGQGDKAVVLDKIQSLEADYSKTKEKHLLERIARLKNKVAVLKVGGLTKTEVEEKKYRVEDATQSTKAAMEDGIVPGGETALLNASRNLPNESVVFKACRAPFQRLLKNIDKNPKDFIDKVNGSYGYDARAEKMCILTDEGIIDPAKVPIAALSNAVSVAVNFLRSQAVVFNVRDVNKPIEDPLDI